jgi:hypothetical protein
MQLVGVASRVSDADIGNVAYFASHPYRVVEGAG